MMNFRENMSRSKEVLAGYFRQGLRELGSVFYGSGTAAQHPEYGMIGTRTPGEIADGMRGRELDGDAKDNVEPSQLREHMGRVEEPEQNAPEIGMDIERE